jgi:hypothetical protein
VVADISKSDDDRSGDNDALESQTATLLIVQYRGSVDDLSLPSSVDRPHLQFVY